MPAFKKAHCAYALLTTTCVVAIALVISMSLREGAVGPELRLATLSPLNRWIGDSGEVTHNIPYGSD